MKDSIDALWQVYTLHLNAPKTHMVCAAQILFVWTPVYTQPMHVVFGVEGAPSPTVEARSRARALVRVFSAMHSTHVARSRTCARARARKHLSCGGDTKQAPSRARTLFCERIVCARVLTAPQLHTHTHARRPRASGRARSCAGLVCVLEPAAACGDPAFGGVSSMCECVCGGGGVAFSLVFTRAAASERAYTVHGTVK